MPRTGRDTTRARIAVRVALLCAALLLCTPAATAGEGEADLPKGVKAVWDLKRAERISTPTRETISLNGLWRWQPAKDTGDAVPRWNWGWFKVPGCWPGISNYMQKDCQTVHAHPLWADRKLRDVKTAWYQRQFKVPGTWKGRRIALRLTLLNSFAVVYLDGKEVGEARFPHGEVDLTEACRPGKKHVLSVCVEALPLRGVMLSFSDTASAREVKGSVARRGLCGDVFLDATPSGARITDVKVDPSVRRGEITIDAALRDLSARETYELQAEILERGRVVETLKSKTFRARDLVADRYSFTDRWKPEKLWDVHTPENTYDLRLSLLSGSKVRDVAHDLRFGFRELWIDGRDFVLNGTRIFLSAVPLDSAQVGAAHASYVGARETLERLQGLGINFVYTHNYGCEPGSHLAFDEILSAADDVGMLVALSQPHFGHYNWEAEEAEETNGYAKHARYYVQVAQNHPSVVAYAMSHNATGYSEDMNPDRIDGIEDPREAWSKRNAERALRAEAIVKALDPSRIVYHHSSGNLGSMHTSNFYANFAPAQELSDWFEHWAVDGVKPLFLCEYGVPFSWDWTMYRGWWRGKRAFGSARVPWEFCLAEWNAQFLGDRAFEISEREKANLRWEAKLFAEGQTWHRWDYPTHVGSRDFSERDLIFAAYIQDNWRAFRTWGVSAFGPWGYGTYWRLRDGVSRDRVDLETDWNRLQRPGFSPDYIEGRYERLDLAFERDDWVPTSAGEALLRHNRPLLAYIAGRTGAFTSKDHVFRPGETVEKQIVVVNNSREAVPFDWTWTSGFARAGDDSGEVIGEVSGEGTVEAGGQARIPIRFGVPKGATRGAYELCAEVRFADGAVQEDQFTIHVLPPRELPLPEGKIALFDPVGQTSQLLKGLGVRFRSVKAGSRLSGFELLIVGKHALTLDNRGPALRPPPPGLNVIVFEQRPEVLEKRLGFRTATYGLRWVFARLPDHPILAGLGPEHLRDWRGEATTVPPRLDYVMRSRHGPTVSWCGLPVARVWRCGNRGNVATALIEKPASGDFLPILDGGFSLQYSPLLRYRDPHGAILLCQLDLTGRTEREPAAEHLVRALLHHAAELEPAASRPVVYAGEPEGLEHLKECVPAPLAFAPGALTKDAVLVAGPGAGEELNRHRSSIATWLRQDGRVLALGLDEKEARAFLPGKVKTEPTEHIAAFFEPPATGSPLAGVGPADVHNRDPRTLDLVRGGAEPIGDGVMAVGERGRVVYCQLVPWHFASSEHRLNQRRTFRRASFLVTRLLANLGCSGASPLRHGIANPPGEHGSQWLLWHYLDEPVEWDDPYRFFRW